MTVIVANTANTNTFDYWRNRTNELADAMTNKAVTVESNTATGNAAITGTFTANIFSSNTTVIDTSFYVGNSTVNVSTNSTSLSISNNIVTLTIFSPTSSQFSNGQYYLSSNGSWILQKSQQVSTSTSGTSAQQLDTYSTSTYAAVEYIVSVADSSSNNYYAAKVLTTHNNVDAYLSEYGVIETNTSVGFFTANIDSSNVRLFFTPTVSSSTVKITRITV